MKRTTILLCCTVILIAAPSARAQHHGGGGHHAGASPSGPTPETKANDISGFERAIALQATPEQAVQFERWLASTREARRHAQEILSLPATAGKTAGIRNAGSLSDRVVDAQDDNAKFLQSFSKEQQQGLKKIVKKLQKADSELTSGNKALDRSLQQDVAGGDQVVGIVQRLDKALEGIQSQQSALATEMGIQAKNATD